MNKSLKRVLFCILTLILLLGSTSVFAASAVSKTEALKTARRYVPSGSKLIESEWEKDSSNWEFDFLTKNRKVKYEVAVDATSGKLIEVEKECRCFPRTCKYSVSKKAAKKKVLKTFKGAKIVKIAKNQEMCQSIQDHIYNSHLQGSCCCTWQVREDHRVGEEVQIIAREI